MSTHANRAYTTYRKTHRVPVRPPFDSIALLLQGGGALGAYQAGVYEALADAQLDPDWVAGISIGAINSALIAGNPPETRVEKLRKFWELVTTTPLWGAAGHFATGARIEPIREFMDHATRSSDLAVPAARGDVARGLANQIRASLAVVRGAPGFFVPRLPIPWLQPTGSLEATSYYDSAPLKATLERLVDFDRINAGET